MGTQRSCVVYGLASSNAPDRVRYIGQTTLLPAVRLRIHLQSAKRKPRQAVQHWINKHLADGHTILMIILKTDAEYHRDEQAMICAYRAAGADLMNHTDGGEGVFGYRHTPEECARRGLASVARAQNRSPEVAAEINQRISGALKGRAIPAEVCAKMAAARLGEKNPFFGQTHAEATRIANAKARARLTDDQVRDLRRRYTAGESQTFLASSFGLSQAQVSQAVRGETYWWVDGDVSAKAEPQGRAPRQCWKLTEDDVTRMRALADDGVSMRKIGALFGISHSHVSRILRGLSLRWVD